MIRRLAEMTSDGIARAVAAGATTVILPLGATEQHGPHLPVSTDSVRASALADGLAAGAEDVLVAPVLPIGCSDEHSGFAGLLGVEHDTLARLLVECGQRMAAWGVRRLVLLSAHGGNGSALEQARIRLRERVPALQVFVLAPSAELAQALRHIAAADDVSPDAMGWHAGEAETSEMLHLRPALVDMAGAILGYSGPMASAWPRLRRSGVRSVSGSGVLGDPRGASAARGARYLATQIEHYRRALKLPPVATTASVDLPLEAEGSPR